MALKFKSSLCDLLKGEVEMFSSTASSAVGLAVIVQHHHSSETRLHFEQFEPANDLDLDEGDAHRHDRETEQREEDAGKKAIGGVVVDGQDIAESNRSQRDEHEVYPRSVRPPFGRGHEGRACADVSNQNTEYYCERHLL